MKFDAGAIRWPAEAKPVRRWLLAMVLLACAAGWLASIAPFAQAGTKRTTTRAFTATAEEVDIHTHDVPAAGGTATAAATIQASPGGAGAQVTHLAFSGPTRAPATFGFTAKATAFFADGSIVITVKGTLKVGAGSSLDFAGQGQIIRGTGRYKRAKGRITVTGMGPNAAPGHVDTFRYGGTISY